MGLRVQGSGFRVQGLGFKGSGLRVHGLGFRVQGLGFRVQGLCKLWSFRAKGSATVKAESLEQQHSPAPGPGGWEK